MKRRRLIVTVLPVQAESLRKEQVALETKFALLAIMFGNATPSLMFRD
jgi:hypothetical protein